MTRPEPLTAADLPTPGRVHELLDYDATTGIFTWKVSRGRTKAGTEAGCIESNGYIRIQVDGRAYLAHRLAWLISYGGPPVGMIDHRNGLKGDNRLVNLRQANASENGQNRRRAHCDSRTGFLGVSWIERDQHYRSEIMVAGKRTYLGAYATPEEAHRAYMAAKARLHPFASGEAV
jgi:hypothetical protein